MVSDAERTKDVVQEVVESANPVERHRIEVIRSAAGT